MKIHTISLLVFLVIAIVFSSWIIPIHNSFISMTGSIFSSVIYMLILAFYIKIARNIPKGLVGLYLIFFLLFFVSMFSFIINGFQQSSGVAIRMIQLLVVFATINIFYWFGYHYGISKIKPRMIQIFILFIISFITIIVTLVGYKAVFINPNALGLLSINIFFISLFMFNIYKTKFFYFIAFLSIYMILISGSRTSLLALIIGYTVYVSYQYFYNKSYYWISIIIFLIIYSIAVILLNTTYQEYLIAYENISMEITNKNLYSGRQYLWNSTLEFIEQKKYFGWGAGATLGDISDIKYSVHNYYLQNILQVGYLGLSIYILLIMYIFYKLYMIRSTHLVSVVLAYYGIILLVQSSEITFTQNNLLITLPFWIFTGLIFGNNYRRDL